MQRVRMSWMLSKYLPIALLSRLQLTGLVCLECQQKNTFVRITHALTPGAAKDGSMAVNTARSFAIRADTGVRWRQRQID
ncbi:hypothetical protein WS97_00900 [Burkholderia territorii]|nr:hypothetical protein WS97_00900 [Burkholderia territorii]KWO64108.1 hypothetical protein WT98_02635 [Burkholderia territorii]